jgi:hypothetical protein
MASSIVHDNIKKVVGLLVGAVHMVKSPANKKKFFLIKGEQTMDDEKLKEHLKEQGIKDDEIKFILSNEQIKSILLDDANEKKALEVIKDGVKGHLKEIEEALESESITDITSKIIKPFEGLTNFLSTSNEDVDSNDNNNNDNDNNNSADDDKELDNSVSELVSNVSELAENAEELVNTIID